MFLPGVYLVYLFFVILLRIQASIFLFFGACYASYGGHSDGGGYSMNGVDAAIHSKHSVQIIPVSGSKHMGKTPVVDINSEPLPLTLRFNSHSTRILPIQKHFSHSGQVYKQNAIDEPDVLIQNIRKPIIQEVREIITPYRKVVQEIQPVMEEIHTIVAKGEARRNFDRTQTKTRGSRGSLASPSARAQSASSSGSSTSPF